MSKPHDLSALGSKVTEYTKLETFEAPDLCTRVVMTSDEVTALCPVTGQPDWYTVTIDYIPNRLCVESKTLKMYLQSLRNKGRFCEALSQDILDEVMKYAFPKLITVTVVQKPRGGVSISATSMSTFPRSDQ